jgi:hypothetical protein
MWSVRASFFDHLVAERGAFRIVLLEPLIGKFCRREHLEVTDAPSFIKLARFLLFILEECISSESLLSHLWFSRRQCGGTLTSCLDLRDHCRR